MRENLEDFEDIYFNFECKNNQIKVIIDGFSIGFKEELNFLNIFLLEQNGKILKVIELIIKQFNIDVIKKENTIFNKFINNIQKFNNILTIYQV